MRSPSYIITWPGDIHPAVVEHVARRLKADPFDQDVLHEAIKSGARISQMKRTFTRPVPAIVRRARALAR